MSLIVVLAVVLASVLDRLTDPQFIASLATLIAALTGLIVALKANGTANSTHEKVAHTVAVVEKNQATMEKVQEQTNGVADDLRNHVTALQRQAADAGLGFLPSPGQEPNQGAKVSDTTGSSGGQ